jgi:hypothetical protein
LDARPQPIEYGGKYVVYSKGYGLLARYYIEKKELLHFRQLKIFAHIRYTFSYPRGPQNLHVIAI